jgi:hypothetical protein
MKKQINPTIKAHLIRSAFYLLLLLAVCAIPFALAQRNAKRSAAKPATVNLAAAGAQTAVPSTGAAGASQRAQRKSVQRELPYDVLELPAQAPKFPYSSVRDRGTSTSKATGVSKRVSQVPKTTSPTGAHRLRILPQPKLPQVVLYDQYNNAGANATLSATFTDIPTGSSDLADDFVVPGGQTWNVQSIDADGVYFNGPGPATDWNVFIYTDSATLPGTQIFSALNQPVVQVGTTFTVNLPVPAVLTAGTYWIEIQANMTFGTQGEWGWTDRTVQSNQGAAWQNPGGFFGICQTWGRRGDPAGCNIDPGVPDQVYRINGTIGGGGTPTPTPAGCTDYTVTTSTDTIVPGTLDTGNHCDDCTTPISFPFPVSLYGTTFTSANVSSNGNLQFTGNTGYLGTQCPLPDPNIDEAILAYQDDLRTDEFGTPCGGAGCGVFTSVSGSAPNRIFNIEWHTGYFGRAGNANFEIRLYESGGCFDIIYGATVDNGTSEDSGVQQSAAGPGATTFSCHTATLTNGLKATYCCAGAASPTPTPTATCTPGAGGLLVTSGLTLGYGPNGYQQIASNTVNYTFANSPSAPNEFAVFQTHNPWGFTVLTDAITANGHTFTTFTPAQLAGFTFSDYRVIVLNWDDHFLTDFLAPYTAAIPALEAYVNAGGVVWIQGAIQGSPGDNYPLPFGGQGNGADFSSSDPIVDPASPMMTGVPNPIVGNFASHVTETGLPAGAHTVVISGVNSNTVLYDLRPGGGCGPSPTPTATPTASATCTPIVINGSIDTGDPTQTDRLFRSGIPQTCPASTSCAILGDGLPRHYDSYTFTNTTGATQCVTIDTNTACTGTNFIFIGAYLGSFDPSNVCTNWIGDAGSSPNPEQAFQVNVDNGQTLVVVVSEVNPDAGCPGYTVTITGLCGGGTPTPTPTCMPGGGAKIYNIAGFGLGIQTTTTRIYDIASNTWTTGAPIPEPNGLSDHATGYWNGTIYIAGGFNGTGATDVARAYDIASDTWTTLTPMPAALYLPGFGVINGKFYVASGNNGGGEVNTLYIYDIASGTWSTGAVVPTPVTGPGSAVYQGKLYLFGGAAPFPNTITTTQIYDPVGNSWTTGPSMNVARLWFYGGAVDDTSVVAPGGDNSPGIPINDNEQLTASWAIKAPLPFAARGPFAVSDGTFVYIGGGYDGSSVHNDLLRYDPVANTYTPLAPSGDGHFLSQAVIVSGGPCGTPTATPTATATATTPPPTPTATATATTPPPTPTATATATATIPPPSPTPTVTPRQTPTPRPAPTHRPA